MTTKTKVIMTGVVMLIATICNYEMWVNDEMPDDTLERVFDNPFGYAKNKIEPLLLEED